MQGFTLSKLEPRPLTDWRLHESDLQLDGEVLWNEGHQTESCHTNTRCSATGQVQPPARAYNLAHCPFRPTQKQVWGNVWLITLQGACRQRTCNAPFLVGLRSLIWLQGNLQGAICNSISSPELATMDVTEPGPPPQGDAVVTEGGSERPNPTPALATAVELVSKATDRVSSAAAPATSAGLSPPDGDAALAGGLRIAPGA